MKHIFLFIAFFLINSLVVKSQIQHLGTTLTLDSLEKMNSQQILQLIDEGFDFNAPLDHQYMHRHKQEEKKMTVFHQLTLSYGMHCDSTLKDVVYTIFENHKTPLNDPLFFLGDPCNGRINDVLELYRIAFKNNSQEVEEKDFRYIIENYYANEDFGINLLNYKNSVEKTVLMYAIEFNFQNSIDYILEFDFDTETKDRNGKTALIYAIENNQIKTVKKLISKGTDVLTTCNSNQSALLYACEIPDKKIFRFLAKQKKVKKEVGSRKKLKQFCKTN